jgi:hypothetical protein
VVQRQNVWRTIKHCWNVDGLYELDHCTMIFGRTICRAKDGMICRAGTMVGPMCFQTPDTGGVKFTPMPFRLKCDVPPPLKDTAMRQRSMVKCWIRG